MQRTLLIRKYPTASQREKILASYQRSGLTQREFALRERIGLSTLARWLRKVPKLRPGDSSPGFVPVANLLAQASGPACYRLRLPDGVIVEVPCGFCATELQEFLHAVQAL